METNETRDKKTVRLDDYMTGLEEATRNRKAAHESYASAVEDYKVAFTPLVCTSSDDDLRSIYADCPDGLSFPRSHIMICASLLLFAPSALYGGKLSLQLAKRIASALGVRHSSVYIARNKLGTWLRLYPEFYQVVSSVFDRASQRMQIDPH